MHSKLYSINLRYHTLWPKTEKPKSSFLCGHAYSMTADTDMSRQTGLQHAEIVFSVLRIDIVSVCSKLSWLINKAIEWLPRNQVTCMQAYRPLPTWGCGSFSIWISLVTWYPVMEVIHHFPGVRQSTTGVSKLSSCWNTRSLSPSFALCLQTILSMGHESAALSKHKHKEPIWLTSVFFYRRYTEWYLRKWSI